ncbi:p21-C-terminal region-binding protein-domain-containing protein, partial [Crucibulum laeve]
IDVDFDFYDLNPEVDYHALKRLLGQLFQRDAELFHLHDLTELILCQKGIGTTIKTDGTESDPYAVLTVLDMHQHHEHPSIKAIANYCLEKSAQDSAFHTTLNTLFSQNQHHVGLVVCERLINMPVQVIPPMYKMLNEEIQRSISENGLHNFSHLLVISRTYHLTSDEESAMANSAPVRGSKKKNKKVKPPTAMAVTAPADGIYSFHPEDEVIKQSAVHSLDYKFTTSPPEPREKDSFGLDNRARMMLVPTANFRDLIGRMLQVYAPPGLTG